MNIQRRTFLGGLLAAVATAKLATGHAMAFAEPQLEEAEERIKLVMPEPEEGYQLLITPGYGLNQIKVTAVDAVPTPPELMLPAWNVLLERPSFFSNKWEGQITPVQYDQFRRCTLKATIEGEDVMIVREWMQRMIDGFNGAQYTAKPYAVGNYKGKATFGMPNKKPMIMIDGLFPQAIDTTVASTLTADVVFNFDYAEQNVL